MNHLKKSQYGATLVEAILSIAILSVVLTAVVGIIITSLNASAANDSENQATNYAQEGLEIMRDKKTANFDYIKTFTRSTSCLAMNSVDLVSCGSSPIPNNIHNKFLRQIYIDKDGTDRNGNLLKCLDQLNNKYPYVSSIVSWNDSKCSGSTNCHKVEISTCFVDNGEIPTL